MRRHQQLKMGLSIKRRLYLNKLKTKTHPSAIPSCFPFNDFCGVIFGDVGDERLPFRISSVDKFLFMNVIGGGSSLSIV